jgi:hypothetical protein
LRELGELRQVGTSLTKFVNGIEELSAGVVDEKTIELLKSRRDKLNTFLNIYKAYPNDYKDFAEKHVQLLKEGSGVKLRMNTIPKLVEAIAIMRLKAISDKFSQSLGKEFLDVKDLSNKGNSSTSADVSAFGCSFSIKNKTIQQTKTRIADTFFE